MSNKKESKLSNYDKHKENPFLKEAVEQIQHNIVKKYKSTGGTSQSAILQAVNSDGELVGHTSFIRQIEVDEEQFTKIYLAQFSFLEFKNTSNKGFWLYYDEINTKARYFYVFSR